MNYESLFKELIENLINEDGSDLHLSALRRPIIRVNGQLIFLLNYNVLTQDDVFGF
jgi:Tfp pilus assembly pilus retraction ATPase PilT